jgi:inositol-phosphate phosphatase / L-galactose 1-phosphate phosphatase / histidinol-phosphatase
MAPMMPTVSVTQTESWKTIDKRQRSGMVQAASADNAVTTSTSSPLPTEYVALAHQLADAAATVTSRYFRTPVSIDVKSDASPVTIADREAEAAMRHVIATNCPDHAVFGEEGGFQAGSTDNPEYMWVIDPIDGTKSFITGRKMAVYFASAKTRN